MKLHIQTGTDNPLLRKKAKPVKHITKDIKKLVKDMEETMGTIGIGLAAPQVGVDARIVLITLFQDGGNPDDREDNVKDKVLAMINPEIIEFSADTVIAEEGCLSIPGVFKKVERAVEVTVRFQNVKGQEIVMKLDGLNAREAQHEIDHLEGVLFVDLLDENTQLPISLEDAR